MNGENSWYVSALSIKRFTRNGTPNFLNSTSPERSILPNSWLLLLGTLAKFPRVQLNRWRQQFMDEVIHPAIRPAARNLLKKHQDNNDLVAIVTATNRFITEPIAHALGVEHLIAAIPEETPEGEITGKLVGIPTSGAGKIVHTENWLQTMNLSFDSFRHTYFYSDSDRDLPLLSRVNHPVAVNPNNRLKAYAEKQGWPLLQLFDD